MHDELENRLVELETRLSFQELTLTELSDALAEARAEASRTAYRLERVLEDLKQVRALTGTSPGEEPPPPHY